MNAYPYEVELKIENKNTRESSIQTRTVYAYNAMDAASQAVMEASADAGSADIRLMRIGPPLENCAESLGEAITRELRRGQVRE
jgi:hypothetical protein